MKSTNRHGPGVKPQMESILSIVAEWALQGACLLTPMKAREQQYEANMDDQGVERLVK